ncbi:MAG: LLM class F420-dependent oxidoreductase [Pseudomonadales bacterium]
MKFVISMAYSSIADILELARTADETGWDAITFSDHIVHPQTINTPYPYTENGERRWDAFTEWPDPWVIIGACAAVTKNLRFTNNVFVLPIRNPFIAAKAISTAAIVSNNRVTLTVGVGWSKDEYQLMQQDFHTRGKRCDEMIEILKKLWTGDMVEHHGEFYDFDKLEMNPAPSQDIPIWVGGISTAAHKRAARLGDGWLSDLQPSDEIIQTVAQIQAYRNTYDRSHLPFEVMASPSDAWDISGYKKLEDGGITHLMTMPWMFYHGENASLEQKKDGIKRFADEIISKMS